MASSPRHSQTFVPDSTAVPSTEASTLNAMDNEKSPDIETKGLETGSNDPALPPRKVNGFAWVVLVVALLSSIFLFALDSAVTANIQPTIVTRFNGANLLPWISVAYLLGAASINLFWGQLYTRLDVKWTFIVCFVAFEAGSALCGGAPNMAGFIIGRTICGAFGSGMYIGILNILALTTYENERSTYFGLVGIMWGFGNVLGPIIGGALAVAGAWRWAFYLNLLVGALSGPTYVILIPSKDPLPGQSVKSRLAPIDLVGTVLLAGMMCSLLMAISFGGVVYEWDSATTIALFVVSGVLFIMFWIQQVFTIFTTAETRIFPMQFLRSPIMVMLGVATACAATGIFVLSFFLPLLYQLVAGETALESGVHLLPFVFFAVSVTVINGILLGKYGYYMPWFAASGIFLTVGSALMLTVDQSTSNPKIYGYSILYAIGVGASVQMPFAVATAKVKPEEEGLAIGYCSCFQFAGPAVAISIANSVFLNEAERSIKHLVPMFSKQAILSSIFGLDATVLAGTAEVSTAMLVNAITTAMKHVYAIPLSCGALILVMSLFMKREKLVGLGVVPGA